MNRIEIILSNSMEEFLVFVSFLPWFSSVVFAVMEEFNINSLLRK